LRLALRKRGAVCVCVCERERARESERTREKCASCGVVSNELGVYWRRCGACMYIYSSTPFTATSFCDINVCMKVPEFD